MAEDGRRIAVVDLVVVLEVEMHGSAIIGAHRHRFFIDLFNGPERAILHAKSALVLQVHDPVPAGEISRAALYRYTQLIAQIAGGPHPLARCLIECADFVIGVGEDDPALVGGSLPVAVPAVDQIAARPLACWGLMHHVVGAIGLKRIAGLAIGEIARGVALPVLPLAAHLADFRPAVMLVDRPERRARFDGLQLLRIANQHHLCASLRGMGQHALQLARADHTRLVDHQHIARREQVASLFPAMLQAGDGARGYTSRPPSLVAREELARRRAQAMFRAGTVSMKARMMTRKSSASHRRSRPKL